MKTVAEFQRKEFQFSKKNCSAKKKSVMQTKRTADF